MKENENPLVEVAEKMDKTVDHAIDTTERVVRPYRRSVFRKFPILFTLLVTFGVVATLFGFERIITDISWLNERPWLILATGLATLVLTGTLYKKLG